MTPDIIIQLWLNTLLTTVAAVIEAQIKKYIWFKNVLQSPLHAQRYFMWAGSVNTWGPGIYILTGKLPVGCSFYKSSWQITQSFFFFLQHAAHLNLHVSLGNVYLHSRWKATYPAQCRPYSSVYLPNCHSCLITFTNHTPHLNHQFYLSNLKQKLVQQSKPWAILDLVFRHNSGGECRTTVP